MVELLESWSERSERKLSSSSMKINGHIPRLCGLMYFVQITIDHQGRRYVSDQILHKYAAK